MIFTIISVLIITNFAYALIPTPTQPQYNISTFETNNEESVIQSLAHSTETISSLPLPITILSTQPTLKSSSLSYPTLTCISALSDKPTTSISVVHSFNCNIGKYPAPLSPTFVNTYLFKMDNHSTLSVDYISLNQNTNHQILSVNNLMNLNMSTHEEATNQWFYSSSKYLSSMHAQQNEDRIHIAYKANNEHNEHLLRKDNVYLYCGEPLSTPDIVYNGSPEITPSYIIDTDNFNKVSTVLIASLFIGSNKIHQRFKTLLILCLFHLFSIGRSQTSIAAGFYHNCYLGLENQLKCWGDNQFGQLGYGDDWNRGDNANEMGANLPTVDLHYSFIPTRISLGYWHSCALALGGALKCWGWNSAGQLGYGDKVQRGVVANQMGANLDPIDLGWLETQQISAGGAYTCAFGKIQVDPWSKTKCWGHNHDGQLGQGDTIDRGDNADEMGANLDIINLGQIGSAPFLSFEIAAGGEHVCAISQPLDIITCDTCTHLKCWGDNYYGQLGYGDTANRGTNTNQMGNNLLDVDFGHGTNFIPIQVEAGGQHFCALSKTHGEVICWGRNQFGQLGWGDTTNRGDSPGQMYFNPTVSLGTDFFIRPFAIDITLGFYHSCALSSTHKVKCWGDNQYGQLGQGDNINRGDNPDEMGNYLNVIDLGTNFIPIQIEAGSYHTCALSINDTVKCWGYNSYGQLGYGDVKNRGDDVNEMGDNLLEIDFGITSSPTTSPTLSPSLFPTISPTNTPSVPPSNAPSHPSFTPTNAPSFTPSITPTTPPSSAPTLAPSIAPSIAPSLVPSSVPTSPPSNAPSITPTLAPSIAPTSPPTLTPSISPSNAPTSPPSNAPSITPTLAPSIAPTSPPTLAPSISPSNAPTSPPTLAPSITPTSPPSSAPTLAPSVAPSLAPSLAPTQPPSNEPSIAPTQPPSLAPSIAPSIFPTQPPSIAPSNAPSIAPTQPPSIAPSITPSITPSLEPTPPPSIAPSIYPSIAPTEPPSIAPSISPTQPPSFTPSNAPSSAPSNAPSIAPTQPPSLAPSIAPSNTPSIAPSISPTQPPSIAPSISPSQAPTLNPSTAPSFAPSVSPTNQPTDDPTIDPTNDPTVQPTISPIQTRCALGKHYDLDIAFLVDASCGLTAIECETQQEGIAELLSSVKLYNNPRFMYVKFSEDVTTKIELNDRRYNDLSTGGEAEAQKNFIELYNQVKYDDCGSQQQTSTQLHEAIKGTLAEFNKRSIDRHGKIVIFSNCKYTDSDPCMENLQTSELRDVEIIIINIKSLSSDIDDSVKYLQCLTDNDENKWMQFANVNGLLDSTVVDEFRSEICLMPTPQPTKNPSISPTFSPSAGPSKSPLADEELFAMHVDGESSAAVIDASVYIIVGLIGIGTLLIAFVTKRCDDQDYVAFGVYFLQAFDMYSDILLAIQLYTYYSYSKFDNAVDKSTESLLFWLFFFCAATIVIPYLSNFVTSIQIFQKINADKSIPQFTKNYFSAHTTKYILAVLINGGCYTALALLNSKIFNLVWFNSGLSKYKLGEFELYKVVNTILLENIPQMCCQIIYMYNFSANIGITVIASLITSTLSILLSIMGFFLRRNINKTNDYFTFCLKIEISKNGYTINGTKITPIGSENNNSDADKYFKKMIENSVKRKQLGEQLANYFEFSKSDIQILSTETKKHGMLSINGIFGKQDSDANYSTKLEEKVAADTHFLSVLQDTFDIEGSSLNVEIKFHKIVDELTSDPEQMLEMSVRQTEGNDTSTKSNGKQNGEQQQDEGCIEIVFSQDNEKKEDASRNIITEEEVNAAFQNDKTSSDGKNEKENEQANETNDKTSVLMNNEC